MRMTRTGRAAVALALLAAPALARAQDVPAPEPWKEAARGYRIALGATPLTLREEPVLKWTNPQRKTDDGAVFVWTDRGRPEVAASFYRYKNGEGRVVADHEFVSLSGSALEARRDGAPGWTPPDGAARPTPIAGAPAPADSPGERLRQMRALAREFQATYNNPPDLSEIRLLPQPLYRFEVEGRRPDVLDGALFAYVHTTDPEVLLLIEARPGGGSGPMAWHASFARMSMVNMRVRRAGREVWAVRWVDRLDDPAQPFFVRSFPMSP